MPFRHIPNSDAQRDAALEALRAKYLGTTVAADRLITAEHFAQLDLTDPTSLFSRWRKDLGERAAALAVQGNATTVHDTANSALAQTVSHFIQVFNFAVARGVFPRTDRAFYSLDMNSAEVPLMNSHAEIQSWAHLLVAGEAARLAATVGAIPMAMPAISEISDGLANVAAVHETQSALKDAYDKEQQDVEQHRPAVDALIRDAWDTIEFKLRALDGPSRRRRAREWGIVYLTRPGEPQDPAEPQSGAATGGTDAPDAATGPEASGAASSNEPGGS